jgi:acyl carrier protein
MAKANKSIIVKEDSEEKDALAQLFAIEQKIRELESVGNPGHYGLPDLLFPKGYTQGFYDNSGDKARNDPKYTQFDDGWCRERVDGVESDEAYQLRQDKALEKFIVESMFIMKDGKQIYVKIIAEMLNWLGAVFFSRSTLTITWKPRGGGGSLTAAVLIFLLIIYHKKSVLDLAGSAEQSKIVYEYVKAFWDIIPGLKEGLVSGDPLALVTRLKTGQELRCSPATQKQARGKHFSVIFVDELCLLPGTRVMTERGLIPVENIVVGDRLINQYGEITTVKRVWSKEYDGDAVHIKPSGFSEGWKVTGNHPVLQACSLKDKLNWNDAAELSETSYTFFPVTSVNIDTFMSGRTLHHAEWVEADGGWFVPIKSISKYHYEGPVWDIEVDSGDSFALPGGIVHNCQEDPRVESAMRAAIQGALSEPEPIICLFSTFHIPVGLFQEYWDNYEERGFARFNWNILDTMLPCKRGIETATADDPKALAYCRACFLTEKKSVKDATGKDISEVWTGCNGYARDSKGWSTFESVCKAKTLNLGTGVFETEFLCARPGFTSSVYSPELIEDALTDPILIDPNVDKISIGIDWGIQTADSLAIIFTVRKPEFVYVSDILYADHTLVSDVVTILNQWRSKYGDFTIIADASHQFNNGDLAAAGFDVRPASFGTWKKFGIENITKHLVFHRIKINRGLTKLIEQLKTYRKNPTTGAIVKKNDHGPDSMNFAMLNFKFEEEFGPDIDKAVVIHESKTMMGLKDIKTSKDKPTFAGMSVPETCTITSVVPVVLPKKDKNVMMF